jgi:hypothetical protein
MASDATGSLSQALASNFSLFSFKKGCKPTFLRQDFIHFLMCIVVTRSYFSLVWYSDSPGHAGWLEETASEEEFLSRNRAGID